MAGQIGTDNALVPQEFPPLFEELLQRPGAFTFAQALHISATTLGEENLPQGFLFNVNPDLSFPPGDIRSIQVLEPGGKYKAALTLNLLGLHGAASPLPAYLTEYVAQHQDEQDAVRDFFNIFNHRLINHLYSIWRKYRYSIQYEQGATDKISSRFLSFIGQGTPELRQAKDIYWPKLMAYMGLISFSRESAGTLERILRHYFNHRHIAIQQCVQRWAHIPDDQCTQLGTANCRLGHNTILGTLTPDQTGKFRICISELSWESFNSFLPLTQAFASLQTLVKFALRSRLDFDVELKLRPEEIRPWILSPDSDCRLGWTAWAGTGGDGLVTLQTDHQEL